MIKHFSDGYPAHTLTAQQLDKMDEMELIHSKKTFIRVIKIMDKDALSELKKSYVHMIMDKDKLPTQIASILSDFGKLSSGESDVSIKPTIEELDITEKTLEWMKTEHSGNFYTQAVGTLVVAIIGIIIEYSHNLKKEFKDGK